MRRRVTWIGAVLCLMAVMPAVGAQAQGRHPAAPKSGASRPEALSYVMVKGDTLYTLSRRYFVRLSDYHTVQRLNRIADPRRIPIGTVITVPVALLRFEPLSARLIAARGAIQVRREGRSLPVSIGMPLAVGTTIETGLDGLLTMGLPNGSHTSLPTRSKVTIRRLRRFLLGDTIDYDLEVGAGKAETEATPIEGQGRLKVRTSRAVSAVRGTRFRIGLMNEKTTAEVLDGVVAVGVSDPPDEAVASGYGAHIAGDGEIVQEALLPSVELVDPGKVQMDQMVALRFAPNADAAAFHAQIGGDAGFVDVIADQVVDRPEVAFADIPNGNWFVRVTAISRSGLEGLYQTYTMKRRLTGLSAAAEGDLSAMRFRWSGAGEGRRVYRFQMMGEDRGALPIVDEGGLGPEGLELRNLDPGTYYWRVGVRQFADGEMTEKWLNFEKLIVAPQGR